MVLLSRSLHPPTSWGKKENGLRESEFFIFWASSQASESHYCQKEVAYWLSNKSIDQFLLVITEGEVVWDQTASDFDWDKTTALPRRSIKRRSETWLMNQSNNLDAQCISGTPL
ncbi:MAG: hypothetical protein ACJAVI_004374 [Candidatus Azotimanducaceae bacterium]|jgi:hypothetical protein